MLQQALMSQGVRTVQEAESEAAPYAREGRGCTIGPDSTAGPFAAYPFQTHTTPNEVLLQHNLQNLVDPFRMWREWG